MKTILLFISLFTINVFHVEDHKAILQLFPEKCKFLEEESQVEFAVIIKNHELRNLKFLNDERIWTGKTNYGCWHLVIMHDGHRYQELSLNHILVDFRESKSYTKLKPLMRKCFTFKLDFSKLINWEAYEFPGKKKQYTIQDLYSNYNNRDYGEYELWLEYNDKTLRLRSKSVIVNYMKSKE